MIYMKCLLVTLFVLSLSFPAMALDLVLGEDFYENSMYDRRTYDRSFPEKGTIFNQGGWLVGLSIFGGKKGEIGRVEIIADPAPTGGPFDGSGYTAVITDPSVYPWLGKTHHDYVLWIGHKAILAETFEVRAFTTAGDSVNFIDGDGITNLGTSYFINVSTSAPVPPICQIEKMKVKNNGDLLVRFTAPYRNVDRQIRIRVFTAEGDGAEVQFKFDPPFEFLRPDGSTQSDMVKAIIPAVYSGRKARIEYRIFEEGTGYMGRGIKYFVLP